MTIASFDQFLAAARQPLTINKTATRTTVAGIPFSVFDLAGNPGAGTLAGTSTAAGVVPTDATAGCVPITDFGAGNTGYLAQAAFNANTQCTLMLFDMVFKAGAYAFNANTALSSQPSYASRMPGGSYVGTEIWLEAVTAFTGNLSVNVTYTNQVGTGSRSTGTVATGVAPIVGRMIQLPLQAGDSGVQKIDNVTATVSSAGTFNILVLRPIWMGHIFVAGLGDVHDLAKTGMPVLYQDSALIPVVVTVGTTSPIFMINPLVANG